MEKDVGIDTDLNREAGGNTERRSFSRLQRLWPDRGYRGKFVALKWIAQQLMKQQF